MNDLIKAYRGCVWGLEDAPENEVVKAIMNDSPKRRLEVYCEWYGIIGYSDRLFEIATGQTS